MRPSRRRPAHGREAGGRLCGHCCAQAREQAGVLNCRNALHICDSRQVLVCPVHAFNACVPDVFCCLSPTPGWLIAGTMIVRRPQHKMGGGEHHCAIGPGPYPA